MGNAFSSFGLAMQGADSAQMEGERIRQIKQSNDLDPQRRAALEQQSQLTGQQIETERMGLEESRRTREADAAARTSASAAAAAGKTMSGSLLDMADTEAKSGRMDRALQYRQAYKSLEEMGAKEVVHTALTDPRPGERPDLVQLMNQNERTKGVVSATLDENGILTVVKQNQKPTKIDVGVTAERLGMVQAPKVHNVPAGGVGVMTQPGRPTQIIQTPKTFPEPAPHVLKSYNAEGQTVGERLVDSRTGKEIAGSGAGPAGIGEAGGNVGKRLPELKEVTDELRKMPGMATRANPNDPLDTREVYTAEGARIAPIASALVMANKKMSPHEAILIAQHGKPGRDENGQPAIQYGGAVHSLATAKQAAAKPTASIRETAPTDAAAEARAAQLTATGQPFSVQGPARTAVPAAPPRVPAPSAAPVPPPAATPRLISEEESAYEKEKIEISNGKRVGFSPKANAWRAQHEKERKLQSNADATAKAQALKDRLLRGYAKGGKVTRMQCHGLG